MKLTTLPGQPVTTHCCDCEMESSGFLSVEVDSRHRRECPDRGEKKRESCSVCAAHNAAIERAARSCTTISLTDGLGDLIWSGEFTATTDGSEFHSLERLQLEAAECLHQGVKAKLTAADIIHESENPR